MYIIGTSTLTEIMVETLLSQGKKVLGLFDDYSKKNSFMEIPILGTINDLLCNESIKKYSVFVAIGDNQSRMRISKKLKNAGFDFFNIIHPRSQIEISVKVGNGNFFGCFSYVGTNSIIGDGNIIFPGVSINHHNKIGSYNFISPNSSIGGYTKIGNNCKIGMNCVLKPYIEIKSNSNFEPLTFINEL